MQAFPCTLNSTYTAGSQIQPGHKNPDRHSSLIGYQRLSSPPAQRDSRHHVQAASQHSTAPPEASAAVTASAVSVQPRASPTDEPQPQPSLAQDAEDAEAGSSSGDGTEQDEEDAASCQDSVSELDPTGVPVGVVSPGCSAQVPHQQPGLSIVCTSLSGRRHACSSDHAAQWTHANCCWGQYSVADLDASNPASAAGIVSCIGL